MPNMVKHLTIFVHCGSSEVPTFFRGLWEEIRGQAELAEPFGRQQPLLEFLAAERRLLQQQQLFLQNVASKRAQQ